MIKQMTWGPDYQVYLKLDNDSSYLLQISELFHANPNEIFNRRTEYVYYPVNFDQSYIDSIRNRDFGGEDFTMTVSKEPKVRKLTLWNALSQSLGG